MARYCDACGAEVGPDDLFCISCGARLRTATQDVPAQTQVSEPLPRTEAAGSLAGLGGSDLAAEGPDSATMVFDEDEDPDAPTFVFEPEPVLVLVRRATGEELTVADGDVVGKGTKASVRVSGNHGISRRHLRLSVRDGAYLIEDLGSTNGTFLGDERLEPGVPREIGDGTVVRIADEDFEFQVR